MIHEKLDVVIREWLIGLNYLRKICLHKFTYNINLLEFLSGLWFQNSLYPQNVVMVQKSHNLQFSKSSLGKYFMLESFLDFLNGNQVILLIFNWVVLSSYNNTISTGSYRINDFIVIVDLKLRSKHHIYWGISIWTPHFHNFFSFSWHFLFFWTFSYIYKKLFNLLIKSLTPNH